MANTLINITENGTTTLATAGKYCDRNIDVTVAVENTGGGGGGSKELLGRANPLPVCYPYHVIGNNIQTLLVPFVWPAGAEKIYIKSELRTESSSSYRLQYRYAYFDFNAVVAGSTSSTWLIVRPNGESDFTTSSSIATSGSAVLSTSSFYHDKGSFLTTTGAINLADYGHNVPTEDTPCVLRISVKGYASGTYVGEIITLQEEAFE